ncbi:Rni-like superfamily protein [Thalictrum thalictroides]|uniref:Rni-like superfamily protein n=1 Tax=Thalictrum thalictroides TaxID=46969 RepID=A0A7J6WH74_THATH|nr:Rni-like superfamily protein [Thalictrum thalictroides]
MAMMAIARRRKLLNDDVLISLADNSWDILDISGSDVSDFGLAKVVKMCDSLRAADISCCYKITTLGVSELLSHCQYLETLRCGGCPRSDTAIGRCLGLLKPKLNDVAGDSWEELDSKDIANGAESMRWLLWPKIDDNSREILASDCPRIVVNPKRSVFSVRGLKVPNEAIADLALDESFVQGIDPNTWAIPGAVQKVVILSDSSPNELPIAEKFRLAFVQRDERLAPKRAKNVRQHQRRAEREWIMTNAEAKLVVLASRLSKSLNSTLS